MLTTVSETEIAPKGGAVMDVIIWVLVIFLAVIVFVVLGTSWQRRSQQAAALEELREHLIGHGMVTATPAEDSPQRLPRARTFTERVRRFFLGPGMVTATLVEDGHQRLPEARTFAERLRGFFLGDDPGYIRVNGMNYDLVTVRIGMTTDRVTRINIFGISAESYHGSSRAVEYHYIVQTGVADARAVKARLRTKTYGQLGIVDVAWRGGRLAAILNAQPQLNMAIKHCFLSTDRLKLKHDRRRDEVRIIMRVRQDSVTGFDVLPFPTAEKISIINRIAGLIRQDVSGYQL